METVKVKPIANAQIGGTSCAAIGTTWRTLRMILYFENEMEEGYDDDVVVVVVVVVVRGGVEINYSGVVEGQR